MAGEIFTIAWVGIYRTPFTTAWVFMYPSLFVILWEGTYQGLAISLKVLYLNTFCSIFRQFLFKKIIRSKLSEAKVNRIA